MVWFPTGLPCMLAPWKPNPPYSRPCWAVGWSVGASPEQGGCRGGGPECVCGHTWTCSRGHACGPVYGRVRVDVCTWTCPVQPPRRAPGNSWRRPPVLPRPEHWVISWDTAGVSSRVTAPTQEGAIRHPPLPGHEHQTDAVCGQVAGGKAAGVRATGRTGVGDLLWVSRGPLCSPFPGAAPALVASPPHRTVVCAPESFLTASHLLLKGTDGPSPSCHWLVLSDKHRNSPGSLQGFPGPAPSTSTHSETLLGEGPCPGLRFVSGPARDFPHCPDHGC